MTAEQGQEMVKCWEDIEKEIHSLVERTSDSYRPDDPDAAKGTYLRVSGVRGRLEALLELLEVDAMLEERSEEVFLNRVSRALQRIQDATTRANRKLAALKLDIDRCAGDPVDRPIADTLANWRTLVASLSTRMGAFQEKIDDPEFRTTATREARRRWRDARNTLSPTLVVIRCAALAIGLLALGALVSSVWLAAQLRGLSGCGAREAFRLITDGLALGGFPWGAVLGAYSGLLLLSWLVYRAVVTSQIRRSGKAIVGLMENWKDWLSVPEDLAVSLSTLEPGAVQLRPRMTRPGGGLRWRAFLKPWNPPGYRDALEAARRRASREGRPGPSLAAIPRALYHGVSWSRVRSLVAVVTAFIVVVAAAIASSGTPIPVDLTTSDRGQVRAERGWLVGQEPGHITVVFPLKQPAQDDQKEAGLMETWEVIRDVWGSDASDDTLAVAVIPRRIVIDIRRALPGAVVWRGEPVIAQWPSDLAERLALLAGAVDQLAARPPAALASDLASLTREVDELRTMVRELGTQPGRPEATGPIVVHMPGGERLLASVEQLAAEVKSQVEISKQNVRGVELATEHIGKLLETRLESIRWQLEQMAAGLKGGQELALLEDCMQTEAQASNLIERFFGSLTPTWRENLKRKWRERCL